MEEDLSSTKPTSSNLQGVVDRAAQGAHDTIDRVAAKAGPALDNLQSMAEKAADGIQERAGALGEMEERWLDTARCYVRDYPLAAVLTGLAVGMLVTRLAR